MAVIVILVGGMILSKLELEFEGSQFTVQSSQLK
jgi:hypothetical protein